MHIYKDTLHTPHTEEGRFGIGQDSWEKEGLGWDQGIKTLFHCPQDMAGQGTLRWGAQTATHPHLQGRGEASVLSLGQRSIHKAVSPST